MPVDCLATERRALRQLICPVCLNAERESFEWRRNGGASLSSLVQAAMPAK